MLNRVFGPTIIVLCSNLIACGWVDSTGRQGNELPQLSVKGGNVIRLYESESVMLDFSDSTDPDGEIVSFDHWQVETQGALEACAEYINLGRMAETLDKACEVGNESCAVSVLSTGAATTEDGTFLQNRFTLAAPAVTSPVGLQYHWTATDDDGGEASTIVTLCIDTVNKTPSGAFDDYQIDYAGSLRVADIEYDEHCNILSGAQSLLANDTDDYADKSHCLSAQLLSKPRYAANDFENEFSSLGGFHYQHNGDASNTYDAFSYRVFDGENYSNTIQVEINLEQQNNRNPIANDDVFSVLPDSENQRLDVLSNDSDPEGLTLKINSVGSPNAGGQVALSSEQHILYTPATGFIGSETFTYTILDAGGLSATADVTVDVEGFNRAPTAIDDSYSIQAGESLRLLILENDSDADGDDINLSTVDTASLNGSLAYQQEQAYGQYLLYTIDAGFSGVDRFSYEIQDEHGLTATAEVTISVYP